MTSKTMRPQKNSPFKTTLLLLRKNLTNVSARPYLIVLTIDFLPGISWKKIWKTNYKHQKAMQTNLTSHRPKKLQPTRLFVFSLRKALTKAQ
jgi:hypothetical protein